MTEGEILRRSTKFILVPIQVALHKSVRLVRLQLAQSRPSICGTPKHFCLQLGALEFVSLSLSHSLAGDTKRERSKKKEKGTYLT